MTAQPEAPRGHRWIDGARAISLSPSGEVRAACPWPPDTFLQGGGHGVVLAADRTYATAFVEAFSERLGFLRGEGATVHEAEESAWRQAERILACAGPNGHEWEARGYTNGAGFCRFCGRFESNVLPITSRCAACNARTTWSRRDGYYFCEEHTPHTDRLPFGCGCKRCMDALRAKPGAHG